MGNFDLIKTAPRHIVFVTGTRADFGKIKAIANQLIEHQWKVSFFVTGMHMLEQYGSTYLEVRRVEGATTYEYVNQRDADPLDMVFAKTVFGFSDWLQEQKPDLVVVHGDRVEAKACAFVCTTNYIRCLHIEGGEVSGTIDEVFRHCISKLAHHHFVCSKLARKALIAMGESEDRIAIIGSPELDIHKKEGLVDLASVLDRYNIPFSDYGVAVFHPVTSEIDSLKSQAQGLFSTLEKSGRNFVVIASNNDPGRTEIMEVIESLNPSNFHLISSMRFEYFSELMKNAAVLVGNSSAGVREAPFLGVPSLNIGTRQTGRAFSESITNAHAHETGSINDFLQWKWGKRYERSYEFGDGRSVERFVLEIEKPDFWKVPKQKYFSSETRYAESVVSGNYISVGKKEKLSNA